MLVVLGLAYAAFVLPASAVYLIAVKKALGYPEDNLLNFTQLGTKYGYNVEEHTVTTEDGYILTLFRMTSPKCKSYSSVPVLLQHGAFWSADSWHDAGNASVAHLIANDCRDLWLGNNRGCNYGRNHATLNPDTDDAFWKYSIDEMGTFDLPATIDYILKETGAEKLTFIGFSQGGGQFFITMSEREEYNDKVNLYLGLAPGTRFSNTKSTALKIFFFAYNALRNLFTLLNMQETLYKNSILQLLLEFVCQFSFTKNICLIVPSTIDSYDPGAISDYTARLLFSHFFAGSSVQQMVWYYQSIVDGTFAKFDYGSETNLEKYGSTTAPSYNISKTKVPSVLFTAENDQAAATTDVVWTANQLPNLVSLVNLTEVDTYWNHLDHMYSQRWPTNVYSILQTYLEKYD